MRIRTAMGGETPRLSDAQPLPKKAPELLAKLDVQNVFSPHEDEDVETLGQGIVLSVPSKVGSRVMMTGLVNPLRGGSLGTIRESEEKEREAESHPDNIQVEENENESEADAVEASA